MATSSSRCTATPTSREQDKVPESPFTTRRLRVESVARRTDSVWLFTFVAADGDRIDDVKFEPGQVAVLSVPGVGEAYMAIASAPDVRHRLEFLVKNEGPFGTRLFDLGHESDVSLVRLAGHGFPVDQFWGRDLLFVAAGTAIAPIRAAVSHVAARRSSFGRLILVHGVRHPHDLAVDDEIDAWRRADVDVVLTVTQPGENGWRGSTGRVQKLLEAAVRASTNPVAFVCGSREMMDETTAVLVELGMDKEHIIRNY